VGEGFVTETVVPGSQSRGLGQGFAHERRAPKCDVDDHVYVDPGRLDVGMWVSGRVGGGSISSERRTASVSLGSGVGTSVGESISTSSQPTSQPKAKEGSGVGMRETESKRDTLTLSWGCAREELGAVPSEQPTRGE
jgi:hypothetical protein